MSIELQEEILSGLDVFYGELTVNRAVVYARLAGVNSEDGYSLAGRVRGPRSMYSATLPATTPLSDLGPGNALLARALVTDPSFWSPDVPAIYEVTVELCQHGQMVAQAKREIGFRPLSVRGKWLTCEGKPWVVRGVLRESATESDPQAWRDARAVFVQETVDHDALGAASQFGAWGAVRLAGNTEPIDRQLKLLARHPAVSIVAIAELGADARPNQAAPNLLLAQYCTAGDKCEPAAWTKIVMAEVDAPQPFAARVARIDCPVIAVRRLSAKRSVADARAACDELQRNLAPFGQYAGYIV